MSLLLALVASDEPAPEPTTRGSGSTQGKKPKRGRYEVDRFSDFPPTPTTSVRQDDEDCLMLLMN